MKQILILLTLIICSSLSAQIKLPQQNTTPVIVNRPAPVTTGILKIISNTNGDIIIDERNEGTVSEGELKKITVKAGSDLIVQLKPSDGRETVKKIVNIAAGKEEAVELNVEDLQEKKYNSSLLIETTLNANVTVNSVNRGMLSANTPVVIGVDAGTNIIEVKSADGQYTLKEQLEFKSSNQTYRKFDLLELKLRDEEKKRREIEAARIEQERLAEIERKEKLRKEEENRKQMAQKEESRKKAIYESIKSDAALLARNGYSSHTNYLAFQKADSFLTKKISESNIDNLDQVHYNDFVKLRNDYRERYNWNKEYYEKKDMIAEYERLKSLENKRIKYHEKVKNNDLFVGWFGYLLPGVGIFSAGIAGLFDILEGGDGEGVLAIIGTSAAVGAFFITIRAIRMKILRNRIKKAEKAVEECKNRIGYLVQVVESCREGKSDVIVFD